MAKPWNLALDLEDMLRSFDAHTPDVLVRWDEVRGNLFVVRAVRRQVRTLAHTRRAHLALVDIDSLLDVTEAQVDRAFRPVSMWWQDLWLNAPGTARRDWRIQTQIWTKELFDEAIYIAQRERELTEFFIEAVLALKPQNNAACFSFA